MQPRQQLLEIGEAVVRASWTKSGWTPGGRFGSNSISDPEQLLCLLLPATQIEAFNLDRPDQTDDRMVQALRKLGPATGIPRVITRILNGYFVRYTEDGTPTFAGGGYYQLHAPEETPSGEHATLPIVDSYALSITLSLATLGFIRVTLRRAREILAERPGTAAALIYDSLGRLDRIEAARRNISAEA